MDTRTRKKRHYRVLGLTPQASEREVREAYRRLAKRWHPDRNPDRPSAEARFERIHEAYRALVDGANGQRKEVPRIRRSSGNGATPEERRSEERRTLWIPFDLAVRGGVARAQTPWRRPCPRCDGLGRDGDGPRCRNCGGNGEITASRLRRIRIPAASTDGCELRIPGGAGGGDRNGSSDLVVELKVRPHPHFSRRGLDLRAELPLAVAEAVLGSSVRLTTPYGERVQVRVPAGTSAGTILRIPDHGVTDDGRRGDLRLEVKTAMATRGGNGPREISAGWIVEKVGERFSEALHVLAVAATRTSLEWSAEGVRDLTAALAVVRNPVLLVNLFPSAAVLDGEAAAGERPGFADAVAGRVSLPEIARRVPDGGYVVLPAGDSARKITRLDEEASRSEARSREIELVERLLASPHLPALRDRIRNIRESAGALVVFLPAEAAGAAADSDLFDAHLALGDGANGGRPDAGRVLGRRSLGAIPGIGS